MSFWNSNIELEKDCERRMYSWLLLSIISLALAGSFAFLVAFSRTPGIQDYIPWENIFFVGLVVHVVLALVIWFLAFLGSLWELTTSGLLGLRPAQPAMAWLGFGLAALGTFCVVVSAFLEGAQPLQNNYIPVIIHPSYFAGLSLFGGGIFLAALNTIFTLLLAKKRGDISGPIPALPFGSLVAAILVVIAMVCFGLAYFSLPSFMEGTGSKEMTTYYFEFLFWGGGHVLQFVNTIGILMAWIFLVNWTFRQPLLSDKTIKLLFSITLVAGVLGPMIYFISPVGGARHKELFTALMAYPIIPPIGIITLAVPLLLLRQEGKGWQKIKSLPWGQPSFSGLFFSLILFTVGGIIGFMLTGINTKIPAHYHGSIGGITLAFMTLAYSFLPVLKREIAGKRAAQIQPYLYGIGQLLFICGLFWAGSHEVQRKTPGDLQELNNTAKVAAMTLMGLGGLVAITAGATFVLNMLVSLFKGKKM